MWETPRPASDRGGGPGKWRDGGLTIAGSRHWSSPRSLTRVAPGEISKAWSARPVHPSLGVSSCLRRDLHNGRVLAAEGVRLEADSAGELDGCGERRCGEGDEGQDGAHGEWNIVERE